MPNTPVGARIARPVRLFALTIFTVAACTDGGGSGPAAPSLILDAAGPPMTVVSGTVTGVTLPSTPITGTVGGTTVTIVQGDGGEFAFAIPALSAGPHPFTLEIGGATLSATVQVTAAVQIADPAAYLTGVLDAGESDFDALEAELATAPDDAALDTAQRRQDLGRIRAILADARQQLATATPTELATAAAFISANGEALGLSPHTSGLVHGGLSLATSGSGACLDAQGNALDTYEECHVQFKAFGRNAVKRLVVLAGATAIAYVEGFSVIGSIGAAITAVAIYRELEKIQTSTFKRFIDPVTARLLSAFGPSQRRGPSLQVQGGTDAEPEYFVADESRVFRVRGEYRSLRASDASVTGLATLVSIGQSIESLINGIRTAFLMSPIRPLVPATPRTVVTRDIPAEYLTLGNVSAGVRAAETATDTAWHLTFSRTGITSDVPFTFEFRYEPPGLPVQSIAADAMLIPEARFIARSLATGSLGGSNCAVDVQGAAFCWGHNQAGKLGDLTTTQRRTPVRVEAGGPFTRLTMGDFHGCGLSVDSLAWCWGQPTLLGDSAAYDAAYNGTSAQMTAVSVDRGLRYSALVAAGWSTCGLVAGKAVCWGSIKSRFDTTGLTATQRYALWYPTMLPGSPTYTALDLGEDFGCGLTSAGTVSCFGRNNHGQLGDGTNVEPGRAVAVSGGRTYKAVTAGDSHACAVTTAGQAYCWGLSHNLRLGDGGASADGSWQGSPPVAVAGGYLFEQIEAGDDHTCALTSDGTAYCWGSVNAWITGDGSGTADRSIPVPVATSIRFSSLTSGSSAVCGVAKGSGAVYCWGSNASGEIGVGRDSHNEPVSTVVQPE